MNCLGHREGSHPPLLEDERGVEQRETTGLQESWTKLDSVP